MNRLSLVALAASLVVGMTPALAQSSGLSEILVDVAADAQPVREVLRDLETQHGLNYVASEQVLNRAGTVTVRLKRVPLDVALQAICSACGLSLEIRGPVLVILPKEQRPALEEGNEGLLPRGANKKERFLPERRPERRAPVGEAQPRELAPPLPAQRPPAVESSMAVGAVLEVDLPNSRLQLRVDGAKRDFFLPPEGELGDPKLQVARLRTALGGLKPGYRVALLYKREGARSVMTDLIGGNRDKVAAPGKPRRASVRRPRRIVPPRPTNPKTAPESQALPDGVLAGRFVDRQGEVVRIRRADGEVVSCELPATDEAERRSKVQAVIDALEPDAQVFLTYERNDDGKVVIRDTGITEVKKQK